MKISFFNLQIIYAALLDWESIFKSISKNIFKNFSGSSQVLYKRNKDTQNKKIDILRTDNFIFIWGWLLIAINSFFGFLAIEKSWPFACYPTFVNIYHPTRWVLRLEGEDANGKNIILDKTISEKISVNRYNSILNKIYESKTSKERTNLLQVFILDLKSKSIIPEKIFGVRLYRDLVKLSPEDWGKNPIERTLIEYIKII